MDGVKRDWTGVDSFAEDIKKGLTAASKKIPSRYLYDRKGSMLFEEIMNLPEYYPTRSELEIVRTHKQSIAEEIKDENEIMVADLGAGNGLKTFILLKYFDRNTPLSYYPIDISEDALRDLESKVRQEFPKLKSGYIHDDYIHGLLKLKKHSPLKKLILFLGSSIGNFTLPEALFFLKRLRDSMNAGDYMLIGFDLKKNPEIIRRAYFDSKGITAKFNLNILKRINRELDADFKEENFLYFPMYNPVSGELKSYLVSTEEQEVFIKGINESVSFKKWESIQTECSNKYDLSTIKTLADKSGFEICNNYLDDPGYFCDSLWRAK